ncbi:MAG: pyridoxal-phosphate dependent enzyme [Gemmatimonadetes bacterium]|nr:pyridoxal-phosphate dependent enzyme [Gemmatimonadota bacterium]
MTRVRSVVPRSPLVGAPDLSECLGRPTHLKLECLLPTGSFKVRGAANAMLCLAPDQRRVGVVTCSSGNHGRAVAYVAERLGIRATVCVPEWVDPVKLAAIRGHGAETLLAGATYDEAEAVALERARDSGAHFLPPFDDPDVVAGQATVALEILDELPSVGEIVTPLSGGGLAGGIGLAVADRAPDVVVTAVTAWRARVMWESLRAGRPIELAEEPTLAGALAGGIGLDNRLTFELVRDTVTRHLTVDEAAIGRAMASAFREFGLVVEGGGAVALAAANEGLLNDGDGAPSGTPSPLVIVVAGGNVDLAVLDQVLAADAGG